MLACKAWRAWVGNSEEHPLVATLVSGLIVSRESPPASTSPRIPTLPPPLSSHRRPFFVLTARLLALYSASSHLPPSLSLSPTTYSPSPFLWHRLLDPTSNPLGKRRRHGRSRFCSSRARERTWGGCDTKRQACPVLACLALSCLNKLMQHSPTAPPTATSSRYPHRRGSGKVSRNSEVSVG